MGRLPDFLGIGAAKSGTTMLDQLLREHPDVFLPEVLKEAHFFDRHFERGQGWYEGLFAPAGSRVCGEISPAYLYEPEVPGRIASLLPEVKLFAIVRDPVERAFSNYKYAVSQFGEKRPFGRFMRENPAVVGKGRYAEQLGRYTEWFPREQLLVLVLEEFQEEPARGAAALFDFLGVDASFVPASLGKARARHVPAAVPPRLRRREEGEPLAVRARPGVAGAPPEELAAQAGARRWRQGELRAPRRRRHRLARGAALGRRGRAPSDVIGVDPRRWWPRFEQAAG